MEMVKLICVGRLVSSRRINQLLVEALGRTDLVKSWDLGLNGWFDLEVEHGVPGYGRSCCFVENSDKWCRLFKHFRR